MSIENGPGPDFLTEKYKLQSTPEVEKSVKKLRHEGEKIPETKDARLDAYFRRMDRALEKKRGLFTHLVKDKLIQDYTINLQNNDGSENTNRIDQLAMGLFQSEINVARRRGYGGDITETYPDIVFPEKSDPNYKEKNQDILDNLKSNHAESYEKYHQSIYDKKSEQEKSLGNWVDYLGSEEANFYPIWFKYLSLRSLQKMGQRDRDTEDYSNRSATTLHPFPDLSREALAMTLTAFKNQETKEISPDLDNTTETQDEETQVQTVQTEIEQMADKGEFARLYAHFQGEIEKAKREKGESTAGDWIHWSKGSDAQKLCETLEGKGTEWCTAGLDVAKNQLKAGEFYIYYTFDQDKKPVDPRIAIYLINGQISEVRGIYGKDQDLELDFVDIARDKYKDFEGSENYEKKDHDMKFLSRIEDKLKSDQTLNKDDLIFLYEINAKIEGFGHGADPRVEEIRKLRNSKEDAPIMMECQPAEIAWSQNEINENTQAYVGPLYPGIFKQLSNLEHIYTSFPEGKISRSEFETTGKEGSELKIELEDQKINPNENSKFMLQSPEFITSPAGEKIPTVRLKVRDFFSDNQNHTYNQIITRADELGLDLLPHETGPGLLLKEETQPRLGEWYSVAMKPIADRNGDPDVFRLARDDDGLWLNRTWAIFTDKWRSDYEFVFRLRKLES